MDKQNRVLKFFVVLATCAYLKDNELEFRYMVHDMFENRHPWNCSGAVIAELSWKPAKVGETVNLVFYVPVASELSQVEGSPVEAHPIEVREVAVKSKSIENEDVARWAETQLLDFFKITRLANSDALLAKWNLAPKDSPARLRLSNVIDNRYR